jgi:tetratricopeptide (TPR) repeat protein
LGTYWFRGGHYQEGWSWISKLLAHPEAKRLVHPRANALMAALPMLRDLGENTQADLIADEALAVFHELGDKRAMAQILSDKGCNALHRGDFARARALCSESAALSREVGDQRLLAWSLAWLAAVERDWGNAYEAAALFDECLTVARAVDDSLTAAAAINGLAHLAYIMGDLTRAVALNRETLELMEQRGVETATAYALVISARIALAQSDVAGALAHLETAVTTFRQAQIPDGLCYALPQLGYARHIHGDEGADALIQEGLRLQHQDQRKPLIIESLERLAWIAADRQCHPRAARLFGAAAALRQQTGAVFPLGDMPLHEPRLQAVKVALGETTFASLWNEGQRMTFNQVVEYALTDNGCTHPPSGAERVRSTSGDSATSAGRRTVRSRICRRADDDARSSNSARAGKDVSESSGVSARVTR